MRFRHAFHWFIAGGLVVALLLCVVALSKAEMLAHEQEYIITTRQHNAQLVCGGTNKGFQEIERQLSVKITLLPCAEVQANDRGHK